MTTPNTPPGRQKNVKIIKEGIWGQDTNNNWHELFNEKYQYVFADGYNDFEMFVKHWSSPAARGSRAMTRGL
ncbi:hypothetical protein [Streptomyces sp. NBC_01483]|uniref:hypothetical protein n=1 Tax=Streptomyces sp. NBC_01483 TaxID=2903883 RepID=UPI002E30B345|nr:hypothetical protein [Streptomyces sp. NBC_01483]